MKMDDLEDIEKLRQFLEAETEENQIAVRDGLFELIEEDPLKEDVTKEEPFQYEDFYNVELAEEEQKEEAQYLKIIVPQGFSFDDQQIIDRCTNFHLKSVMIYNRTKRAQLIRLNEKLTKLLIKCDEDIDVIKSASTESKNQPKLRQQLYRLGYPYFKDDKFFPCPLNADTIKKQQRKELPRTVLITECQRTSWSALEKKKMINTISKVYTNYLINEKEKVSNSLQATLKYHTDRNEKKEIQKSITNIDYEIFKIKLTTKLKIPPLGFNEGIDWDDISEELTNNRHSPVTCKAFWNIYLHPLIDKEIRTSQERKKLRTLAKKYNYSNWDRIAKELGTSCTAYIVCSFFYKKLCVRFKKNIKFTDAEDEFLKELIENLRVGPYIPWNVLPYYFEQRTKQQLYNRYNIYLVNDEVRKGKFSEAEDAIIVYLHRKFDGKWPLIADCIPERSLYQIRERYNSALSNIDTYKGSWTTEEDQEILNHVKIYGENQWSLAHKLIKEGRGRANIRHRYTVLKKWVEKMPNFDLAAAPRRCMGSYSNISTSRQVVTNLLIDKLDEVDEDVPDLANVEEYLKEILDKTDKPIEPCVEFNMTDDVDRALVTFFQTTTRKENPEIGVKNDVIEKAGEGVRTLLKLFDSTLELPDERRILNDENLDLIDKSILCFLKNTETMDNSDAFTSTSSSGKIENIHDINYFIPINYRSVFAFRNLIIHMNKLKFKPTPGNVVTMYLKENDVFWHIFRSIMKWPALLAITNVPEQLINHLKGTMKKLGRNVGRPAKHKKFWKTKLMLQRRWNNISTKNINTDNDENLQRPHDTSASCFLTELTDGNNEVQPTITKNTETIALSNFNLAAVKEIKTYSRKSKTKIIPVVSNAEKNKESLSKDDDNLVATKEIKTYTRKSKPELIPVVSRVEKNKESLSVLIKGDDNLVQPINMFDNLDDIFASGTSNKQKRRKEPPDQMYPARSSKRIKDMKSDKNTTKL